MRRLGVLLFLFAALGAAQVVPGLFIVELEGEHAAATADRLASRRRIGLQQTRLRQALESRGARVVTATDTVMNAVVVETGEASAAALGSLAGVKRVYPVYEVRLALDHALPLHKVDAAWQQVGGTQNAGAGMRIAIVDTGIDPAHPAFQDPGLRAPAGFPKGNNETDLAGTNNKVIVARSYERLVNESAESRPADRIGHGTAVAMVAAGVPHRAPYGEISGVAPKAFLGNYKVFAGNDRGSTRTHVVVKAIDDAVADGMDVINLSLGTMPAPRPEDDALFEAVERAAAAGVIVTVASSNGGPDPNTISSPASAPSVIAVGAQWNDRIIGAVATIGEKKYSAIPGAGQNPKEAVRGRMADLARLDGNGLACQELPGGSLEGKIAFILRGECFFEVKLNNAHRAGAIAAVVYTDSTREVAIMAVGTATLPGMMVTHEDGLSIKTQLLENGELEAELRFEGAPFPVNPNRMASFSGRGPGENSRIAPHLVAVGVEVYTATQNTDREGDLYEESGYTIVDGTSFSAPLVAGAAAVLKAARPMLAAAAYRSLLVNATSPLILDGDRPAPVQQAGSGVLNLKNSLAATAVASPTALSFGTGGSTADVIRELKLTNLGESDTFQVSAVALAGGRVPQLGNDTLALAKDGTATLGVRWAHSEMEPRAYEGMLILRGTRNDMELRVPYWFAVPSKDARHVTVLSSRRSAAPGSSVSILLRVTDGAGIALLETRPAVTVTAGGGSVERVTLIDTEFPGVWETRVKLGPRAGQNTFFIRAGEAATELTVEGAAP